MTKNEKPKFNALETLRVFFEEHEVWQEAARPVKDGANSEVYFRSIPGEYYLIREDGKSWLRKGKAPSPDFSFVFPDEAIRRFESLNGDNISDFAMLLFELLGNEDDLNLIGFRVSGSIGQILKRGYLQVVLKGGPRVLQYAASHGIRSLGDFGRLLKSLKGGDIDWGKLKETQV